MVQAAQQTWEAFLNVFPSKIAAGEAIFTAIFDASPSLQATFKSPKATVAERFVKGFGEVVRSAGSKSKMMNCVQILGFRHLELEAAFDGNLLGGGLPCFGVRVVKV